MMGFIKSNADFALSLFLVLLIGSCFAAAAAAKHLNADSKCKTAFGNARTLADSVGIARLSDDCARMMGFD